MKTLIVMLLLLMGIASGVSGTVHLAWSASPSTNVTGYFLYAHTNLLDETNLEKATVKVNAGTNLTAIVESLRTGFWYFAATARVTNGTESLPSNVVVAEVPESPTNMRTLVVQYGLTVTNFVDAVFFRVLFQ